MLLIIAAAAVTFERQMDMAEHTDTGRGKRESLYKSFENVLQDVDSKHAYYYELYWPVMTRLVNQELVERDDLKELVGDNPYSVMFRNHACHVNFITSIFKLKSSQCLVEVVVWVYRSYTNRGFSPKYFQAELSAWKKSVQEVISEYIDPEPIIAFYDLMIASHDDFLYLAKQEEKTIMAAEPYQATAKDFLESVLKGDERGVDSQIAQQIRGASQIPQWWESVVTPVLHRIGQMWSQGLITVAEEHLATAIVRRLMARHFPGMPNRRERGDRQLAVVVPQGEQHDVGAEMVRDCLDICGYDVLFTGADTPSESIVMLLKYNHVDGLLISTTMPYNLAPTMELIEQIRGQFHGAEPYIIVGGQAYSTDPELWRKVGADAYENKLDELVINLENRLSTNFDMY